MVRNIEYQKNIKVEFSKDNIKIYDSYTTTDEKDMAMILSIISIYPQYNLTRERKELIDEWKFHNLLYKLHLFRSHTKDTDLNENESKFRKLVYKIVGKFI